MTNSETGINQDGKQAINPPKTRYRKHYCPTVKREKESSLRNRMPLTLRKGSLRLVVPLSSTRV